MIASWLILDFASELPFTYYPLYIEALGGTAATIGLIGAVEAIARGIVQIPGGYLADKYGRKWLIASMTFVAAFSRLFYIFAPTWEWILVGAFLVGITNIYGPALMAIVADSVPEGEAGDGIQPHKPHSQRLDDARAAPRRGTLRAHGAHPQHEARLRRRPRGLPRRRPPAPTAQGDRRDTRRSSTSARSLRPYPSR